MPRCCSICRLPGHIRSHCPSLRPLPQYSVSDMQGIDLLEFLRAVVSFKRSSAISREHARYSDIAHSHISLEYNDDDGGDYQLSYMRQHYPGLQIVRVRFRYELYDRCREGPKGYDDDDDRDLAEEEPCVTEENVYIALPAGLVGDLSSIEVSQFEAMEITHCWCGGEWDASKVLSIELV